MDGELMSKQYYCEMDKSVFSTEEELIQHIKDRYVKVFENKDHEPSDLLSKLKRDFPEYEINIKEGKGWFAQYVIELRKGNSKIYQHYGNYEDPDYRRYNPTEYNELVNQIIEKIGMGAYILLKLNTIYEFHEVNFLGYSYGYSEDEHSFDFEFKLNEDNEYITENFYPYNLEIDEFIAGFRQYFATVLEGTPSDYRDGGYFLDYTIDGVQIGEIMKNKKVRLEVLE